MRCPLVDYKKNYKTIAVNILAKVGVCALMMLFTCWCIYMA